ncbi:Ribonuclease/ribotoxin [Aspergillus ambiguus]|uniref:Ribonuclease/ribotoxin n=1 Tax=Aspergillus ambiguus TaxID=176160 RepID=UPI003CCCBD45
MRPFIFRVIAVAFSVIAEPIPTLDSIDALEGIDGSALNDVRCGNTTIKAKQIDKSSDKTLDYLLKPEKKRPKNPAGVEYPHEFRNEPDHLAFLNGCTDNTPQHKPQGTLYEFPIFANGIFTGGQPGPDRIVIKRKGRKQAVYCGLMTHTGAHGNGFVRCSG